MTDSFPRQHARTQRFTLGAPRNVTVSPDGERVVFLRSRRGTDAANSLWVLDLTNDDERIVADPWDLLADDGAGDADDMPDEERARRERLRESAGGITAYATDADVSVVAFALAGRLFVAGLLSGHARPLAVDGPVFDPRPDPGANRLAYLCGRQLRIGELDGRSRVLAEDPSPTVTWGAADFIAAEEMKRFRGFWWSPDGERIAACRVDTAPVAEWVIADPADPGSPARTIRYPATGTANAITTLHVLGLDGSRVDVDWDREFFPYVTAVDWSEQGLVMAVQSADQRGTMVLRVDDGDGTTAVLAHDYDDAWIELVPGTPELTPTGELVTCADRDGARRLLVDGEPVTPADLQVQAVLDVGAAGVTFQANPIDDATVLHVWRRSPDGELVALTDEPGIHGASVGGDVTVIRTAVLDAPGSTTTVSTGREIDSLAERPLVTPNVELVRGGPHDLDVAVLLPHDHDGSPLPVLLDPYGGPHGQRVVRSHNAFTTSQWFADQGFAVVVADGRGTPGRGSEWERAVHLDLASAPLEDQIEALALAAEQFDVLDVDRVAIRGWSFGGYLAGLAVLRRPDVFHAAIAGAPVTDWRLYDTHYTERYLGLPDKHAEVYDACSLVAAAADLTRPLLLIHGLADDNVVGAHTLQLSSALLAAGRPHEVLPLVGVTHITPQEVVAENLLLHQLDFLQRALGLDRTRPTGAPDDDTTNDDTTDDDTTDDDTTDDPSPTPEDDE